MSSTNLPSSFDGDRQVSRALVLVSVIHTIYLHVNPDFYEENRWQKFSRRLKEEPLLPFGVALTSWAVYEAYKSINVGDHNRTQRMFRARIAAQAFTLVAMVAGSIYWKEDRDKWSQFEKAVAAKKAKEKNEAWIRELEARDAEDKEIAAKKEADRQKRSRVEGVATCVLERGEERRLGVLLAVRQSMGR